MDKETQMQELLNRYQYDRSAYLQACYDAGINTFEAAAFCDEVYRMLEQNPDGAHLPWLAMAWILLIPCLLVGIVLLSIWYFIIPQLPPMP